MTRPNGLIKSLLLVCLAAFPVVAQGATSEFRVLFDVDNNSATGCVVSGMLGVDQVLVTRVTDTETAASVTQTHRQLCVSGLLGAPVDVNASGWPVGWQPTSGHMLVETRAPFSAFGSGGMPPSMRVGFTGTRGAAGFATIVQPNGDPIMVPKPPAGRRHAVGHPGPVRVITLDGQDSDWYGIPPLVPGTAGGGASDLKLIQAFSFADPNASFLYFNFNVNVSGLGILAVNDSYTRLQGVPTFTQPAPGVLGNDVSNDGPLTAVPVGIPDNGSLALNADGSFTYTPTDPNSVSTDTFEYKAVVGDEQSNVARVSIHVEHVDEEPAFTSANSVQLQAGVPANFTVTTSGVPEPTITFTGTLPVGVTFNNNGNGTATIGGTPANGSGGTYLLVLTASNSAGTATQNFTIVVCNTIAVTNPVTSTGTAGAAFSETFTQTGAVGSATFTLDSGVLPAGLTLATNGTLSGTPTVTGSFPITVRVTDSNGCTGVGPTYNLVINCQTITVTNPATTAGTAGTAFSQTFTQSGAIGGATFTTASTLPAGLTLAANGTLSGIPTQTGSFPIVVTVTDSNGCTGTGATYTLVIGCQTITVTNPATTNGTMGVAFSQTFTQSGAISGATFTTASTLPTGLTLAANGTLSGTPTQGGTFPIVVTVTDGNGCTGTSATYNLLVCPTIAVTNPANAAGTASSAFSETFTETGAIGGATFTIATGTLPAGLSLSAAGVLSGTPTQTGSFPITVLVTDGNGCTGTSATYNLVIACQTITVTNPGVNSGTVNIAFSQTFTQTAAIGATTFTTASTLPAGLSLATNGTLSGTPTQTGTFPIVVTVTDGNGCTGSGATYTLTINCQVITVNNPLNTSGTVSSPFSETFTASNTIGAVTFTTASTLPTGLSLSAGGVLSGTPTQTGSFNIVVTATDANGCTGASATYALVIGCQTITVTNPANPNGTVSAPFSETFTQTSAVGGATFTLASGVLPAGLTLATNGLLSGTPTQSGSFPITVTVTDGNGCTGTSATYNLVIACQVITVTNPANATGPAGTSFSETFTQTGAIGTATFTTASTLPTGLTLATNGTLSGTPTQTGTFPITVLVTDSNGCTGTSATYTLVITCQTITVTNPATTTGTASSPFSQIFTQTGAIGSATFTTSSTLPAGLSLAANGTLSGTPTQTGSFPITVTVTDANGCTGTGATYTLVIGCQVIAVNNPANANGTASSAFSETFTATGAIGATTFTLASGVLPAGLTLNTSGTLSGIPTQTGSFPITVTATDSNGCTGTSSTYTLVIGCQVINVTNPATTTGTVSSAFSQTFTQTGAIGTATFTTASTLPAGLTLATNGTLSGTPTEDGSFPIVVTVTDSNGCTGTSATYTLVIGCQTITVTNPANANGTVSTPFSETFTQTSAVGGATFTTASTLPAGLTLATNGVLSGTPTQSGSFPIVVTVTDGNGCTGTSATYNLVIACQVITVTNPANATGPAGTPFSETFTQTGAIGTATFTTASTLPTGLTLSTAGVLSGTPTQGGTFPIVVTVTDSNGCTGTSATYNLIITCPIVTVTNPGTTTGTAGSAFSQTFTQSGGQGTITFTTASTLPTGLTLATNGTLSGTPTQTGSFPIVVTATDQNGCTGTGATYTLVIGCQTITVTNPGVSTGVAAAPFSQTFTQTAAIGGATFTLNSGTLPAGLTLATNGTLSGTPTQTGSFPITVLVTDGNGCTGVSATYTLIITCQTITVTNPATTTGTVNAAFSQTFTQVGAIGSATFTTASTLPAGLSLSTAGVLSGTPSEDGTFPIVVTVTDSNGCTGTSATYNLVIACQTITVTNPANANGTVGTPFSETFTETGALGGATFTTASTLPAGLTLSTAGVLSGTPTQSGSFPIVVTVTDGQNSCTGTSATYNLVIACQVITVTNPGVTTGTVDAAFSQTFTQASAIGTATFTTSSTLPSGLTLSTAGVLSGTPGQPGSFPITVLVTDSNGCTGTSAVYTLVIACQTITVTNPGVTTGTVDALFSQTFTQSGVGTHTPATFTTSSTLPSGLTLATNGTLSGTPGQPGTFPIVVTVTDVNGCSGTGGTYTLIIACQVITVTNPGVTTATYNQAFSRTFTQTGVGTHTPATFTTSSTLPTGITLSTAGVLAGTPTQTGTFPIVVTVTDANACTGTSATYTLAVAPVANADTINGGVDNTQLVLTGGTTPTPGTPSVQVAGTIKVNDLPSAATVTVVSGVFATTAGGSVTVAADGTFLYTPPVNSALPAITSDTFNYTVTSNTGGTGPVTSAPGTVTINLVGRVWFVKNDAGGGGNGQSQSPFNTLVAAQTASTANDFVFVYFGNGTTSGQNAGFTMKNGQKLHGQGVALVVNGSTLVTAGSQAHIANTAACGACNAVDVLATAGNMQNIEIRGLDLASTNGNAIDVTSTGANGLGVLISNNTFRNAGLEDIDVNSGSTSATAAVTIENNDWVVAGPHSNNGIDVGTTAGTLNLKVNTNTNINVAGNGINISGSGGGTLFISGFADNFVHQNTIGTGINIVAVTFDTTPGGTFQTVLGGVTRVGTVGNGVGANGIGLQNVAGDLSFTDLDITNDNGQGLNASGLVAYTGSAGFQIAVASGVADINSVNGGISLSTVTANLPFNTIISTNSVGDGVALATVLGSFSAATGSSITNASFRDFIITGGSANVTYNGTITDDVGTLVQITGQTGTSTKSFTGAITDGDDGDGSGISLTGNSATTTMTFSGGLVLSTGANAAFTATGGGVINVIDPVSGANKVTTTTATAVNISGGPTIGSSGVTFESINVDGNDTLPTNAIVLNNTGSGPFVVTGTGAGFSGGTIRDTSGDAILLTDTQKFSIDRMSITSNLGSGIRGTRVNGFVVDHSSVTNNADSIAVDESGIELIDLIGTAIGGTNPTRIDNTTISNNFEFELQVTNTAETGNLVDFQMNNNVISSDGATLQHGNLVNFLNRGTHDMTLNLVGGSFTGAAPATGSGVMCDTGTATAAADLTCNMSASSFTNNNNAVTVSTALAGSLTFDVKNIPTATGNRSHGLNLFIANNTSGAVSGKFTGNSVGTVGVTGSGSDLGFGIRVQNEGLSAATPVNVLIDNNTVTEMTNFAGINVNLGIVSASTRTANVTITNNDVSNVDNSRAIIVQQNNTTSPGTVCANISGNDMDNATIAGNIGDGTKIRFRQLAGGTFNVTQKVASAAADPLELDDANSNVTHPTTTAHISVGGAPTYNQPACPQP